MQSLLLQRIIFNTLLRLVTLDVLFWMQNVSPQLSNAVRWQFIGMREAGMSLRQIVQGVDHHQSTVSRIVHKHRLTNDVKDRPRSRRSRITSRRENNALGRLVRRNLFANSTVLKRQWLPHRLLSARTVRNHLKSVGYRSRRHAKRCLLT